MTRYLVGLATDISIKFPKGMEPDPSNPETQTFLRETFIDFLQSAQYIELGFHLEEDDYLGEGDDEEEEE